MLKALLTLLLPSLLTACHIFTEGDLPVTDKTEKNNAVSGIEKKGMDTNITPQDDFFEYANGTWLRNTEIPADKSSWGTFSILHEQTLKQLKAIVNPATQPIAKSHAALQIHHFYTSYMDERTINQQGLAPLEKDLGEIAALRNHDDIAAYFGQANRLNIDSPLSFWINQDAKNTQEYISYLTQSGLGLPDREYYFDETEKGNAVKAAYLSYLTSLLALINTTAKAEKAQAIMALEEKIAALHWTKVENRNRDKTYNKLSKAELAHTISDLNPEALLKELGISHQENFIIRQPSYLKSLNQLFKTVDVDTWKNYLRIRLLEAFSYYLSHDIVTAAFEFQGKVLNGQREIEPRWKRAINAINANMGELLGRLYIEKHFPPEAKARMLTLVQNLQLAYGQSIRSLSWMNESTQEAALEKLSKFTLKIGYPDQWKDYSDLSLTEGSLVENIKRLRRFNHAYEVNKLGRSINRDEWFMPPQTVNAYYNASLNEIVFPAAILQPPFFNILADDAVNYGAIGSIIGHEISHGFDDQGSKSDGDGQLVNWWDKEDRTRFNALTQSLVTQYNQYEALPGLKVNGKLTLGENIGDLSGVSIAYKAYEIALNGKRAPVKDGFTGSQRFFLGWAQAWRTKRRPELKERLIKTDPHSPARFRVNGVVTNIDAFYRAFNLREGDALYRPPSERVRIW